MRPSSLGSFLTYKHWTEGKKLLDFQIEHKKKSKYYNKLNFFYFEKISNQLSLLDSQEYFDNKVASNLFYALSNEFFSEQYLTPKKSLGLRPYYFFSYPLMILQYAISTYLVELTDQYLKESRHPKVKSYYGGLLYLQNNELVIKEYNTTYNYFYKEYKSQLDSWVRINDNRVAIKLDTQNFYSSINTGILLQLLNKYINHSTRTRLNFNQDTINQIEFFFQYINKNNVGIPQSDNNLSSSFVGHLYLHLGDNLIVDTIKSINENSSNIITNYQVVRYVDDTYIFIDLKPGTTTKVKQLVSYNLLTQVSEAFYKTLQIHINSKVNIYDLSNAADFRQISLEVGNTSDDLPEAKPSKKGSPEKLEELLSTLTVVRSMSVTQVLLHGHKRLDYIKNIFDSGVEQMLNKPENQQRLRFILKDFDYDLCRLMPQALICLFLKTEQTAALLKEFIKTLNPKNYHECNIILLYLCQTNFSDNKIVKQFCKNKSMKKTIKHFKKDVVKIETGYCQLKVDSLLKLKEHMPLLEQIRLRKHNESLSSYSVSLNLMLNEIHYLCCHAANEDIHRYGSKDALVLLEKVGVDSDTQASISTLFDRRNHNPISHAGDNNRIATYVEKEEYIAFKNSFSKAVYKVVMSLN